MMSFLNDDEGNTRLVRRLKLDASFSDCPQFMSENSLELAFRDSIAKTCQQRNIKKFLPIDNDSDWFISRVLVELNHEFLDHV